MENIDIGLTNDSVNSFYVTDNRIYAATNDGVFYSTNRGLKWIAANKGIERTIVRKITSDGVKLFAATNKGFFVSSDEGNSWLSSNDGLTVLDIDQVAVLNGYVLVSSKYHGLWKRSVNNITSVESKTENTVSEFALSQNYPNPFNPSTVIQFELKTDEFVTLKIFDTMGREVAVLVNGFRKAGLHKEYFNASGLSSGIYFYKIRAGNNFSASKKMILIK